MTELTTPNTVRFFIRLCFHPGRRPCFIPSMWQQPLDEHWQTSHLAVQTWSRVANQRKLFRSRTREMTETEKPQDNKCKDDFHSGKVRRRALVFARNVFFPQHETRARGCCCVTCRESDLNMYPKWRLCGTCAFCKTKDSTSTLLNSSAKSLQLHTRMQSCTALQLTALACFVFVEAVVWSVWTVQHQQVLLSFLSTSARLKWGENRLLHSDSTIYSIYSIILMYVFVCKTLDALRLAGYCSNMAEQDGVKTYKAMETKYIFYSDSTLTQIYS